MKRLLTLSCTSFLQLAYVIGIVELDLASVFNLMKEVGHVRGLALLGLPIELLLVRKLLLAGNGWQLVL